MICISIISGGILRCPSFQTWGWWWFHPSDTKTDEARWATKHDEPVSLSAAEPPSETVQIAAGKPPAEKSQENVAAHCSLEGEDSIEVSLQCGQMNHSCDPRSRSLWRKKMLKVFGKWRGPIRGMRILRPVDSWMTSMVRNESSWPSSHTWTMCVWQGCSKDESELATLSGI